MWSLGFFHVVVVLLLLWVQALRNAGLAAIVLTLLVVYSHVRSHVAHCFAVPTYQVRGITGDGCRAVPRGVVV